MFYLTYTPRPPLSDFVDYLWLFEGGHTPRKERIVPSGTSELVINLCDDEIQIQPEEQFVEVKRFSGAVLSGTYSRMFVIDAMQHRSMLGVHFKPGGAFPFLDVLANDLTNAHADLADLWGSRARELRERLCAVSKPRQRFQIMQEFLTNRLRGSRKGHRAVAIALNEFGPYGTRALVREVVRDVGICQRRFSKVFAAQVGITPKVFCRILRFQSARSLVDHIERPEWAQIASTCGYFDQAHLINDFREFSGFSPTQYLRNLRRHQEDGRLKSNHVPSIV